MKIQVVIAQFPVSPSIPKNLENILNILEQTQSGDLALLPEGGLSGYSDKAAFFAQLDEAALRQGREQIRLTAQKRGIHVWVGACYRQQERWWNAAWGFTPSGETCCYHKINLATGERQHVSAGRELPVFKLQFPQGEALIGVQICRELRFPEQWGWLARQGAQVILHLNNATGNDVELPVWRSHLVSRAAETQRFVLSANNADELQKCPTMAIAPSGQALGEIVSAQTSSLRVELDLAQISNWYLSQCRSDVVKITNTGWLDETVE